MPVWEWVLIVVIILLIVAVVVLMVQLDGVTDSRLKPETLDKIGTDPIVGAAIRDAAVAHLATHLTRVIAIMPVEKAMVLMAAADAAERELGTRD